MPRPSLAALAGVAALSLAAATLAIPSATAAPSDDSFCSDGTVRMAPVADVLDFTEGTLGHEVTGTPVTGLSVVAGTEPTPFTGEYIGHVENALGTGKSMLLFELSSDTIDGKPGVDRAGIWAGMSGSPVYTEDGRLIGAVAYGLNSGTGPVAGITPAEYMKSIGTTAVRSPQSLRMTRANVNGPASLRGSTMHQLKLVKVVAGAGKIRNDFANRTLARTPKGTPVSSAFRAKDFGAVGAPTSVDEPLQPGGNIAVSYTTGDAMAAGVGTVTAVCGDEVFAFGHPMDYLGKTGLAMSNASTAMIVPQSGGLDESYKLVKAVGQPVGVVTEDRMAGVRGRVGEVSGVPITVTARNSGGDVVQTYSSTAVEPRAAAYATAYLLGTSVLEGLDNFSAGTARVMWRIDYRRANGSTGHLTKRQVYADAEYLLDTAGYDAADDVWAIGQTDLENVTVTGVKATVTLVSDQALTYRFRSVQVKKGSSWTWLRGKKLAKNRTHRVRPVYTRLADGRPNGVVHGTAVRLRIGPKARGWGNVTFSPRNEASGDCIEFDGETICFEFGEGDEGSDGPQNFAELLDQLGQNVRSDRGLATTKLRWVTPRAKGATQRKAGLVGPGVLTGSRTVAFRIR